MKSIAGFKVGQIVKHPYGDGPVEITWIGEWRGGDRSVSIKRPGRLFKRTNICFMSEIEEANQPPGKMD